MRLLPISWLGRGEQYIFVFTNRLIKRDSGILVQRPCWRWSLPSHIDGVNILDQNVVKFCTTVHLWMWYVCMHGEEGGKAETDKWQSDNMSIRETERHIATICILKHNINAGLFKHDCGRVLKRSLYTYQRAHIEIHQIIYVYIDQLCLQTKTSSRAAFLKISYYC